MIVDRWWHDLRLACRSLLRAKGFSGAAVLTLALGITGTTVMFAVIQGVLLRQLPVRDQGRLIVAWKELRSTGFSHWPFLVADIDTIRGATQVLESVAGVGHTGAGPFVAVDSGSASYINVASVTGDFFDVLGVEPMLGRAFHRADDRRGAEKVLVITNGLWLRRYGGARDVIGRRTVIGDEPFTIVGVTAPDTEYPRGVEAWMTVATATSMLPNPAFRIDLDMIARMRPGATAAQVTTELQTITSRLENDAPAGTPRGLSPVVRSYADVVVGDVRRQMLVLFGAVALVLLIASANVANLLLLRGEVRRPEFALRAALGASRTRLARQVLAESIVLAVVAGGVGLALTTWALPMLVALVPEGLPRLDSIRIDGGVVMFTTALAVVVAVLASLVPVLHSTRTDLASHFRGGGLGTTDPAARRGRQVLVVAQVALAVTVVAAAGLLTRSLLKLQTLDMGVVADQLVFLELQLPKTTYASRARHFQFLNDLVERLEATPEVIAATPVNVLPFSGTGGWDLPRFTAEGQDEERAASNPALNLESIRPNYFDTFEVPLVRGRAFTDGDREGAPNVAIVSEDVAARVWGTEDPVGKRIKFGRVSSANEWRTIVGVVKPTRYRELTELRPTLYLPAEQFIVAAQTLMLRTPSPVESVARIGRDIVGQLDADTHVIRVAPFVELTDKPLARPRFTSWLIGLFGSVALLLTAVGLYGVIAAHVRQRYREIGVRLALGATAANVRRLIVGEGLRLGGLGAAIGLVAIASTTRLLRGLLFDVNPLDPLSIIAATLLLLFVSALASYVPARRAMRVDPVAMLRAD